MQSKFIKISLGMCLVFVYLGRMGLNAADTDMWGYLAFGRVLWETRTFPFHDLFSYLPVNDCWIFHEWLTGAIFYPIFQVLGPAGLQTLRFALGLATPGLIYLTAKKHGATPLASALCLLSICHVFCFGYSPVRAQIFTYFFLALCLYILESTGRDNKYKRLWLFGPIGLLWCNLHGGFIAGLGVTALYCLGRIISGRRYLPYAGALAIFSLATLVNPYFTDMWWFTAKTSLSPWPEILEWLPVFKAVGLPQFQVIYIMVTALAAICVIMVARYGLEPGPMLVLFVCAYLAFEHVRHVVLFAIAFAVYMPALFAKTGQELRPWVKKWPDFLAKSLPTLALCACLAVSGLYFIKNFATQSPFSFYILSAADVSPSGRIFYYPSGAVDFIKQNKIKGNLLADYSWGSFITWNLYPDCLVGVDNRTDSVYPEHVHKDYFIFCKAQKGWQDFLNKYPHDMILVSSFSKIYGLLKKEPQWQVLYEDTGSVLFSRLFEKSLTKTSM